MSDSTYRELRDNLERFAKELDGLAWEAEELANDPAPTLEAVTWLRVSLAAYYAASDDAVVILSRFPSSDDD